MNRQWLYARQPRGKIARRHLPVAPRRRSRGPRDGEALVRTRMLSLDPANRAWMMGKTYRDALEPGQVMSGFAIGEVVEFEGAADLQGRRHRRRRLGLAGLCRRCRRDASPSARPRRRSRC